MKNVLIISLCAVCSMTYAQSDSTEYTNQFWSKGWHVQAGMDMTLQNPYGHDFSDAFREGSSLGVDIALGKQFTKELTLRGKLNWENGITKSNGNWLAPFNQPGVNHDKGGYITFVGDVMLDVKQIFHECSSDKWSPYVFMRAGGVYNYGVSKGSPLLGGGLGVKYKMKDRWSLYADAAYNMVSSGFTGVEKATGANSNSNGFLDINVGIQYELSNTNTKAQTTANEHRLFDGNGWFAQLGLDLTLVNPYGYNFSNVFPKGWTAGFVLGAGKWFNDDVALRARLKLDNNIIKNSKLEWIGPLDSNGLSVNGDNGGFRVGNIDVMLNMKSLFGIRKKVSTENNDTWKPYAFIRAGVISNRATKSGSPLVGAGLGTTYKLKGRWSLYGDLAYQVSTSEPFAAKSGTGMSVSKGSNGFFDLNLGVQFDF